MTSKQISECNRFHPGFGFFLIIFVLGVLLSGRLLHGTTREVEVMNTVYVQNASVVCSCSTFTTPDGMRYGDKVTPELCRSTGGEAAKCVLREQAWKPCGGSSMCAYTVGDHSTLFEDSDACRTNAYWDKNGQCTSNRSAWVTP